MQRSLFDFLLPEDRIATHPAAERDGARLLVLDEDAVADHSVRELADLLPRGALLVVNDTKVIPARLIGRRLPGGGKAELLLVTRRGGDGARDTWHALGRASKPLRPGSKLVFEAKEAIAMGGDPPSPPPRAIAMGGDPPSPPPRAIAMEGDPPSPPPQAIAMGETPHPPPRAIVDAEILGPAGSGGLLEVALSARDGGDLARAIETVGHVPLPPYMRRADEAMDRDRYQTVYARAPGAVAAPTAGLHLSEPLLERVRARGVTVATITLHVGLGTFQPVTVEDLDDHAMHEESFIIPEATARAVADARARGAPVVAVGTTSVRALESAADATAEGLVRAMSGATRLLIQPGYRFRVVDQLLTNFHLPQSTLIALVAAFAGRERVLAAYAHAIRAGYRFYSYGDAMLVRAKRDGGAL